MEHTDQQLDAFAAWERRVWESRAQGYAESLTDLTAGAADALLDAADVDAGTRVLDVATGPGVVALAAQRRGAEVVAVDQAAAMVRLARAAGVDARQATADALPFEDNAFDAVVGGFLLNHLARPEVSLAELVRVCRGRVALSVWDVPDANPALGLFGPIVDSFGYSEAVPPGPDSGRFAEHARMVALLAGAGLEDVRVDRVSWTITVEPGRWFDAIAAGTPRTGGALAAAGSRQRAQMRERYIVVATAGYASADGRVSLPAAAVIGSGRKRGGG